MPVQLAFDLGLPLIGVRLDALVRQLFVDFQGRVVEAELDDREIGSRGLEVVAEPQIGELELGLVQIGEGFAEVDQHQVALVPDERERARTVRENASPWRQARQRPPARSRIFRPRARHATQASEAHHLVQDAVAFGGERNCRDFRGDLRARLMSRRHETFL